MTITKQDETLIALLQKDARMSVAEMARRLKVSRTAARARLDKLERRGVIKGYGVRLSKRYLQGQVQAMVMIKSPPLKRAAIEKALLKMSKLQSLYSISGVFDLVAVIAAQNIAELDSDIDQIGQLKGVEDTLSSIILSTKLSR